MKRLKELEERLIELTYKKIAILQEIEMGRYTVEDEEYTSTMPKVMEELMDVEEEMGMLKFG